MALIPIGAAWRAVFIRIVKPDVAFASRLRAARPPCGKMLACGGGLRFDPNQTYAAMGCTLLPKMWP
jgi:hypothetical protein